MHSTQDSLGHANGIFGGIRISDTIGNTGFGNTGTGVLSNFIYTGNFGILEVHSISTLSDQTISNVEFLTGFPLPVGTYGGFHTQIQLSGGDITVYRHPKT